jgi:hypothetical protein
MLFGANIWHATVTKGLDSKADVAAGYLIGSRRGLPGSSLEIMLLVHNTVAIPIRPMGSGRHASERVAAYESWVMPSLRPIRWIPVAYRQQQGHNRTLTAGRGCLVNVQTAVHNLFVCDPL